MTDGRRTTEPSYPISSPGAFGSGELKTDDVAVLLLNAGSSKLKGMVSRSMVALGASNIRGPPYL